MPKGSLINLFEYGAMAAGCGAERGKIFVWYRSGCSGRGSPRAEEGLLRQREASPRAGAPPLCGVEAHLRSAGADLQPPECLCAIISAATLFPDRARDAHSERALAHSIGHIPMTRVCAAIRPSFSPASSCGRCLRHQQAACQHRGSNPAGSRKTNGYLEGGRRVMCTLLLRRR